jgi:CRISPR-associated protein Cst2
MTLNFFATILTHAAPSSNYRGESEENRTILQKITRGEHLYSVISPEAMRNALREILARRLGPDAWGRTINRRRLHQEGQLAVEFSDYPDATRFADDFLFGYMVADEKALKAHSDRPAKRDSVLRMNLAVSVEPYQYDATFHQSPMSGGDSPWKNATSSALIHREVNWTAFQFPVALAGSDFSTAQEKTWGRELIHALGELSDVAGGHARSYFEMAPQSLVIRLTPALVGGFSTYAFQAGGSWSEMARLGSHDLDPAGFWIGGALVRDMEPALQKRLDESGAVLEANPQRLLERVADAFLPKA